MFVSIATKRILQCYSTSLANLPEYQHLSSSQSKCLNFNLHQYSHKATGAKVYHFQNNDLERAYASVIKTYPKNSKGSPHILEHLACCGSQKYPIRDPFFNMIKRSVNTYMNAWTGDDFTAYPFASANHKDWLNLYQVYLDMSLSPLLNQLDFMQEGWRFQIDEEGNRQLKGIVLNEMKGAYQDSDRQLMLALNQSLLGGTPYSFDSGGKPTQIVKLEYPQLLQMYKHYYNPSNMAFYLYGEGTFEEELSFLHSGYLSKYGDKREQYRQKGTKPARVEEKYRDIVTYTSECNNCSINYWLGDTELMPPVEAMSLKILSYLLLEKANAEFYKTFIQAGTAQTIGFSGLNVGKFTTFVATLKGIYPTYKAQQFQKQFQEILQSYCEKGVDMSRVQEYIYQTQTKLRTPRSANGIRVLQQTLHLMNHNLDFSSYLNATEVIREAAEKMGDRAYISELINRYFLKNQQVVVVRQLMAQKAAKQEQIISNVEIEDQKIRDWQEQLEKRQKQEQDASVLPNLQMGDLIQPQRRAGLKVHEQSSNNKRYQQYHVKIDQDINFYRLAFNFHTVSEQFMQAVMLWAYTINSTISTTSNNYQQLTHKLATNTSQFNVYTTIGHSDSLNIIFQFSCLQHNTQKAFELVQQMIFQPLFQEERTNHIFQSFANQSVQSILQNPMNQCQTEAASSLTLAGYLTNSYQHIKNSLNIIKNKQTNPLKLVSQELLKCSEIKLIEHSPQEPIKPPSFINFLLKQSKSQMKRMIWEPIFPSKVVTHSYGVNFCSQQYPGPSFLSKDHAHLNLLLQLLQQEYLHPRIRQQNGAYGTGARVRESRTIALSSYLDPNPSQTFKIFDSSIQQLLSRKTVELQQMNQVKIMQIGALDRLKPPQSQGLGQILKKYTQEEYQSYRNNLKLATFDDLKTVGDKYLKGDRKSRCIFGKQTPQGFTEQKLKDYLI